MDPAVIAGLILAALGVAVGLVQWLWPRSPKSAPPQPVEVPGQETGLKVRASFGFLTFNSPPWISEDQMLLVSVANRHPRPFRVVSVGLEFEGDGRTMPWVRHGSQRPLPFVLNETEDNQFWLPLHDVGRGMIANGLGHVKRLRAFVHDSYNEKHVSEWVDCVAADWAHK
jgi:hypothetical protein